MAIAQTLGSALIPRGTVEFANLPSVSSSDIKDGYMWNISDPFTTTSDFVEGAGLSIPMGANVYRITINNVPKWDILAGSSAQVYTGTEAQIEQAIQQGLLGEGVMINSLDDGEDELLTTSMIYHHNESLEDVIDGVESDLTSVNNLINPNDVAITTLLNDFQGSVIRRRIGNIFIINLNIYNPTNQISSTSINVCGIGINAKDSCYGVLLSNDGKAATVSINGNDDILKIRAVDTIGINTYITGQIIVFI